MKKADKTTKPKPARRREYDFTGGVRGKYVDRCTAGTNIVVLDPDVAHKFKSSKSVNAALRDLLKELT